METGIEHNRLPFVVSLEDHFVHPKVWDNLPLLFQERYKVLKDDLMDLGEDRIRKMDAAGITYQVVSHVEPGVKLFSDTNTAIQLSIEVNDYLHAAIQKYPNRLGGFAVLPMQSPIDAANELERAVLKLGFKGAMIDGHTNGKYLNDECFFPVLAKAQALDVPIYIHPTTPPAEVSVQYFDNSDAIIIGWAWQIETSTHLIKMINAGIFDKFPNLKIIIGHMGELIPYGFTRLNLALTMGNWIFKKEVPAMNLHHYFKNNIFITSSGVFDAPVFNCAREMLGIENMMFSVDYPFQDNLAASDFLKNLNISTEDRNNFSALTAISLLKIDCLKAAPHRLNWSSRFEIFKVRMKSKLTRYLIGKMVK